MQADNENKKNEKQHLDIPIVKLIPLRKRNISKQAFRRILASIKMCGLLAPLLVYPENDNFIILDGYPRALSTDISLQPMENSALLLTYSTHCFTKQFYVAAI